MSRQKKTYKNFAVSKMAATFAVQYANEHSSLMNANEQQTIPNEAANGAANAYAETGDALRVRLGVQPRTFQKVWKRTFGYAFDSRRIVTGAELEAMEAKYLVKQEVKPDPKQREKRKPKNTDQPIQDVEKPGGDFPKISKSKWGEIVPLVIAFALPTLASAFNTYSVSHQFSKNAWVALFVMCMVTFTPVLFIAARMDFSGVFVAFCVVAFEAFCNTSATYLSLMGDMEIILDSKRGKCSDFLQSVVNLTNSDHRPTAILLGLMLAVIIAATQLTAFWGIRKRL